MIFKLIQNSIWSIHTQSLYLQPFIKKQGHEKDIPAIKSQKKK